MAAFRFTRRVQFAETDMAGIVHFSAFFRYMEEAEHAMWREVGLSLADAPSPLGFPRVAASCDYVSPLRFDDEIAIAISIDKLGPRSIRYRCDISRGEARIATGAMTCVAVVPHEGASRSVPLPARVIAQLTPYLASRDVT